MNEQRITSPEPLSGETADLELSLRPNRLKEFIGQETTRKQLGIYVKAARQRGDALDHVLIFGPPGLGKTTLAHIISNELSAELVQTSGPVLEKQGDVAAILTNLPPRAVLFVDEIHRLNPVVEEVLYPAMEDYRIDIMIGQGPGARSVRLNVSPFTLVGATTRTGLLTSPLRDRFGIVQRLDFYNHQELAKIVARSAKILGIESNSEGIATIAERARGTPRIANRILRRVRDFAQVEKKGFIDEETASDALDMLEIDHGGLDILDRKLLTVLLKNHNGGPVGVDTLAAALSEERSTIEDTIEPFLLQQGYLQRTPRGRVAAPKAWEHLGLNPGLSRAQLSLV